MMRKTLSMLFTLAVVVAPAVAHAEKPFRVNSTGVGASLEVPVNGCTNCFKISVEQDTVETGPKTTTTTTTMDLFFLSGDTLIDFSGSFSNANVTVVGKEGHALSIYFRPSYDFPGSCSGSLCSTFFSLSFTWNHAYSFRREGSEHGFCANGTSITHIEDKFKQTFESADVAGVIADAPFFSSTGQLSTFRGDPDLTTKGGAAPCVLP